MHANAGDDLILGGPGDDAAYGADGNDVLIGGPGDDRLWGGFHDDLLIGGPGDDILGGNSGHDSFQGGPGFDVCHALSDESTETCETLPVPLPDTSSVTSSMEDATLREEDRD
jgi:hypothetical protein